MTLAELSAEMAARGLTAEDQLSSPWYVQVMMGACAWFAGMLLLLFVALAIYQTQHQNNWGLLLFLGIVACGGAAMLYASVSERSSFGNQFALSMSCAGQFAIAVSIGELSAARVALWGMVLVEVVLVLAMRNRLHRFLSTLAAVISWALAMHEVLFGKLPGLDWSPVEPHQTSLLSFLLWLVVWSPVAYGAYRLVAGEAQWMANGRDSLLRPVTHGLIAALAIAPLATHPGSFWMALRADSSTTGAMALWPLLSMFLALLSLALAFAIRNRPLMGVAMVFGLSEVSAFYYVLGTTLLIKSVIMLVIGAALLASAQWLAKEST